MTGDWRLVTRDRRLATAFFGCLFAFVGAAATAAEFAQVAPRPLTFPADHGAHPAFRTEWWYVTGWLEDPAGRPLGFQVTFFRTRRAEAEGNPSAFAASQILIAHAALSDPQQMRLHHDQRVARTGFGLAAAQEGDTDVTIDEWFLRRESGAYLSRIEARDFALDLAMKMTQPPLPQGEEGFSQKGSERRSASHYYSVPHLAVSGTVRMRDGRTERVTGEAWLDHEWSSEYIAQGAVGWDWIGINLDDGGALMAFRMRGAEGRALWAGGTLRAAGGRVTVFRSDQIAFEPLRHWRSPRTGTEYPVAMQVTAGDMKIELQPLFDDQELDARTSSGTIYWEGAVRARGAGKPVGRGYLELTGYWRPMQL